MNGIANNHYWSVDVPGLTEQQAHQLVGWLETQKAGWFGNASAVDPREWLTLHLDRDSAETIFAALSKAYPDPAAPEHSLVETFSEWLAWSSPQP